MIQSPRGVTLVDCRWLGRGGPGRVTEHLLRGLTTEPPDGRWLLWGTVPPDLRWPGVEVIPARHDPHDWYGQRALLAQPRADRAIWCHQYRPLRRSAPVEVGIIYDTIPLRWGSAGLVRSSRRRYLRRVAAMSDRVVTVSEFSKRMLVEDLRVPAGRIDVIGLPVDAASIDRIVERRRATADRPHVLYVGRFAGHKNLDRLVAAFPRTGFAEAGGRLVVVGGTEAEVRSLDARAGPSIDVRLHCSQDELEELMATAAASVQPSLEEGYGLPLAEALAAGVPAAAADAGALPEVAAGRAALFDPLDLDGIASGIDRAVAMREVPRRPDPDDHGPAAFAEAALASLARAARGRGA